MVERRDLRLVRGTVSLEDLPDVLTVEEAAKVLRIGRGAAYELARQWRLLDGQYLGQVLQGRRSTDQAQVATLHHALTTTPLSFGGQLVGW